MCAGEGFHSDGARLGGSYHAVPEHIGRIKALEAAEKRRVKSTLMGKGGRLGGAGNGAGVESVRKSPREMAVEVRSFRITSPSSRRVASLSLLHPLNSLTSTSSCPTLPKGRRTTLTGREIVFPRCPVSGCRSCESRGAEYGKRCG